MSEKRKDRYRDYKRRLIHLDEQINPLQEQINPLQEQITQLMTERSVIMAYFHAQRYRRLITSEQIRLLKEAPEKCDF